MKRSLFATTLVVGVAALGMLAVAGSANADKDKGKDSLRASLKAFDEVPAISSIGTGELRLKIVDDDTAIEFKLTYQDLEGLTTSASHIHLGQKDVIGGVSVFFCGGGGRPPCTPDSGTFTGTITATDVMGPAVQGIAPAEFAELLTALRAGKTYVNVHTDKHPGGEIRGQITRGGDDDDDD
jgi:CHRD domain-containing protein